MGVRGYPEEGYGGDSLLGSYFNGLFEESPVTAHYKGIIKSLRFMVNAVDWLYTRIALDGETLDLAVSRFSGFRRELDFRTGIYTRELVWHLSGGKDMKLTFERLVSMKGPNLGCQRITFEPLNFSGTVNVRTGLDFSIIHEDQQRRYWQALKQGKGAAGRGHPGANGEHGQPAVFRFPHRGAGGAGEQARGGRPVYRPGPGVEAGARCADGAGQTSRQLRGKNRSLDDETVWGRGMKLTAQHAQAGYEEAAAGQRAYWSQVWADSDIAIEGDPENQQGIRFCIFQLYQTYHGDNPGFNIGAKGLTGEAYRGLAFWDTESYCLPFYIFNNPKAAKSLLEFRYKSLPEALKRARELDCEGAFYPIATIDGTESCDLWQHSNLQLHVGTAVAYGLRHYVSITGDKAFLFEKGAEMLIQISRFYAIRGQWGQQSGLYGYFGVMGRTSSN
ncbi:hypothetical protein HMSSN036_95100 [Paenibacillus macerans]|nr:hypothetical protein HMSSN036_95100 [Paenibacillus macerans]